MADSQLLFDAVIESLNRYGDIIVTNMRQRLFDEQKLASGDLYNSIQYSVEVQGDQISLIIASNDYLQWVSDGVRPGGKQPPPGNILKWVETRGIRARPYRLPNGKSRIPTNQQLSFLIGRSISIRGIKPTNIIEETFDGIQDQILLDLSQVIAQSITKIIGQEMQESANIAAQQFINDNIKIEISYN